MSECQHKTMEPWGYDVLLSCCEECGDHEYDIAKQRITELESRLHEVQEIYAGMEGFIPETAPEGYCLQIIEKMYKAAVGVCGDCH